MDDKVINGWNNIQYGQKNNLYLEYGWMLK